MVRTIVTPQSDKIQLDIPQELIGKPIEVTYRSLSEETNNVAEQQSVKLMQFWGIISNDTAKALHHEVKQSRDEWERNI